MLALGLEYRVGQSLHLAGIANASIVVKKLPVSRYLEASSPNRIALPSQGISSFLARCCTISNYS